MKNYSRQREAIMRVLCSTDTHPTAQQVYEAVRKEIPNISLGTVYRNLAALSENGDILCLTVGGFDHFDGDIKPHVHLRCRKCGHIADAQLANNTPREAAISKNFTPDSEVYVIFGVCAECQKVND